MRRMPEGVQAQAPSDRAQATPQRRKTIPVFQVSEAVLPFGLVQPAHEPPLLVLQTLQRIIPTAQRSALVTHPHQSTPEMPHYCT